jgi:hypothetical protein
MGDAERHQPAADARHLPVQFGPGRLAIDSAALRPQRDAPGALTRDMRQQRRVWSAAIRPAT